MKINQSLRYRIEKYFWSAMVIPTVIWWKKSILWVALLSIYALVLSAGSAEHAARSDSREQKLEDDKLDS